MKEAVLTWLDSGCDPIQGVSLLERAGGNPLIIRIAKVNPAKNVSRVRDELCRMFAIVHVWKPKGKQPARPAVKSFREEFPFLQAKQNAVGQTSDFQEFCKDERTEEKARQRIGQATKAAGE